MRYAYEMSFTDGRRFVVAAENEIAARDLARTMHPNQTLRASTRLGEFIDSRSLTVGLSR